MNLLNKVRLFVFARHYVLEAFQKQDFERILDFEKDNETELHFDKIYLDFSKYIAIFDMNAHTYKVFEYKEWKK